MRTIDVDGKRIKLQIVRISLQGVLHRRSWQDIFYITVGHSWPGTLHCRNNGLLSWGDGNSACIWCHRWADVQQCVTNFLRHLSYWSFVDVRKWHQTIRENASEGVSKILIGNKTDEQARRQVTEEKGCELADELGMQFMETSAKTNEGVTESFYALTKWVVAGINISIPEVAIPRDIIPRIVAIKGEAGATETRTTDDSVRVAHSASQGRSGICCWMVPLLAAWRRFIVRAVVNVHPSRNGLPSLFLLFTIGIFCRIS